MIEEKVLTSDMQFFDFRSERLINCYFRQINYYILTAITTLIMSNSKGIPTR